MTVRRAAAQDRGALLSMAWRFLEESRYRGLFDGDVAQLDRMLDLVLGAGVAFVAVEGGDVVGMIAGFMHPHPMSGERTATELAWWVEPEFRGGTAGGRLLKAFETWAEAEGACLVQMIAPSTEEELQGFYTRRGYEEVETTFQRRLGRAA